MAYVITNACTKDDLCAMSCPDECITLGTVELDGETFHQYFIDPSRCTDCGTCEAGCPSTAIWGEYDLPDNLKKFAAVNAAFYNK